MTLRTGAILFCLFAFHAPGQSLSPEKERAIGQQYAAEMRRGTAPVDNPVLQAYVKRIGDSLAAGIKQRTFGYTFETVQADFAEPAALPGGFVLVPVSFISMVQDEGELAGVLGHAIAHIALGHGTRPLRQSTNTASVPILFMSGMSGCHVDCRGASPLIPPALLDAQRTNELEADRFALELVAGAGYPPAGLRRYVARRQTADSGRSPLPARALRLAQLDSLLATLPAIPDNATNELARIQDTLRTSAVTRRVPTLRR